MSLTDLTLSNRICTTFADASMLANNWGFYLFSPEFDDEPELQNKIAAIWITSLLDNLEAGKRSVDECLSAARARNYRKSEDVLQMSKALNDCIGELLGSFSRAEQLFLQDFRHQIVHGHLRGRTEENKQWKYYDGVSVVSQTFSPKEFGDETRDFYHQGADAGISPLREKFLDRRHRYWDYLKLVRGLVRESIKSVHEEIVPHLGEA